MVFNTRADGQCVQSQRVRAAAAPGAAHSGSAVRLHAGGEGRLFQSPQERAGGLQRLLPVTRDVTLK